MHDVVVLVPDEHEAQVLGDLPGVTAAGFRAGSQLPPSAADAEVLVAHGIEAEDASPLLAALPRLRMVQLLSSGVERWAPVVPQGVHVSNADHVHGAAVAEWVAAQLLAHCRDLATYRSKQQDRVWQAHRTGTLVGAKVLVFGSGDIGEGVRARLAPFGCELTMVGRSARDGVLDLATGVAAVADHDVVVLALPLDESTTAMVGPDFLASMPDGAILVNAGRGRLVDTDALLAESRTGRLHAILDVTDPEPLPSEHPLWTAPGVVITPHAAAITTDIRDRIWDAAARKIADFVTRRRAEQSPSEL